ncbi:hypothetical protein NE237_026017 [Protea cynaroides]|uniref:Uncharacterized protein n=1 Tax=Protea cynaroides TaxID=273540 RepID=A0A9Q0K0R9_9MAGN|nr:hypothetical protein NE237_026017 [Protea cynaroides]
MSRRRLPSLLHHHCNNGGRGAVVGDPLTFNHNDRRHEGPSARESIRMFTKGGRRRQMSISPSRVSISDRRARFFKKYETSAHLWLVLEYCVCRDLMALLWQDCQLPEDFIHDIARDLVKRLAIRNILAFKTELFTDLRPSTNCWIRMDAQSSLILD